MKPIKRNVLSLATILFVASVLIYLRPSSTAAQPAVADPTVIVGRAISTQVVTLKVENQRGEPRIITGKAKFDGPVQGYWLSVVGYDIKFAGTTEKLVNR